MALLKVLLLLGLGVSVNSDVSLQKRIIGGHDCAVTERLYHVRLEGSNGTHEYKCGGSLIHPKWILTTDTCWKSETGWINVPMFKVHPRTSRLKISSLQNAATFQDPEGWLHDIMLLKLKRAVTDIPLAPLPDCSNRPKIDDVVQLAGEGATTTGPNNRHLSNAATATNLQCVDMKVVEASHFLPTYGHVFSASAPNKDVCYGDAGSAVVFNGMIYGLTSPGIPDYACESVVSVVDLCEYIGWIRRTIGLK
ncbi:kallikrein 1-related peptidase b27-like isoform X2 [Gambusia affinis]|uniref:kallikrein 1-related peptidase b27-like isoform X1 n=1 Tax=Gambusia affinis TaxID=33528 RepID=UPI001CDD1D5C|nr:kallikrein 1-related peptidase b27-like isoform X1 [Gambusia affinis]XP_043974227.1 kallikrein 1-related peptidase b27-like isoform X2 [Gambusia affinis]